MDKAQVMKLVKRGPHSTSCWAWRGMLAEGGIPTMTKGEYDDPGRVLGAVSTPRRCKNKLCVNPAHREGAQEKPLLAPPEKPKPKPNTKARTLKLRTKQKAEEEKAAVQKEVAPTASTTPATPEPPKPEPKVAAKPKKPTKAKLKTRKSTKTAEKTHCNNGHPWIAENIWTSPSTGKSKCKVCERERKARAKAKKKAAKK